MEWFNNTWKPMLNYGRFYLIFKKRFKKKIQRTLQRIEECLFRRGLHFFEEI